MVATAKKAAARRADNIDGIPNEPGVETWSNTGQSLVHITRIGEYGRRTSELVYGGRVFAITPQERRINQSQCYLPASDPFTNGTFTPVSLLDDEPDTEGLRTNPNVLNEQNVNEIFGLKGDEFNKRLMTITNINAVNRLIDLAGQPSVGATVEQLEILRRYASLLSGDKDEPEPSGTPKPVTPR